MGQEGASKMRKHWSKVAGLSLSSELEIEQGVSIEIMDGEISVTGPRGGLTMEYNSRILEVFVNSQNKVVLSVYRPRRFEKSYMNTIKSHIKNMMEGVKKGFTKTLITAFAHFPMRVEVDQRRKLVLVHNFLGEKRPRVAKIAGDTDVRVEGDKVIVEGTSKVDVGQTAANLRLTTKIKRRDPRVFMDGIYVLGEK